MVKTPSRAALRGPAAWWIFLGAALLALGCVAPTSEGMPLRSGMAPLLPTRAASTNASGELVSTKLCPLDSDLGRFGKGKLTPLASLAIGDTEFLGKDMIVIGEVRGPSSQLAFGETYLVRGWYRLASAERATLVASVSTSEPGVATMSSPCSAALLKRGTGQFRLELTLSDRGFPHLTFYGPNRRGFGGVYFGVGDWLLREKGWSYFVPEPEPDIPDPRKQRFQLL